MYGSVAGMTPILEQSGSSSDAMATTLSGAQARVQALEAARLEAHRQRALLESRASLKGSQNEEYESIHMRSLRRIVRGLEEKRMCVFAAAVAALVS